MTPPSTILIIFLFVSRLLSTSSLASDLLWYDPLFFFCSADSFTSRSPFASNLRSLLSTLISIAPNTPNLFFTHTSGSVDSRQAYGLAQCRPDVSASACSTCLVNAANSAFNSTCPGMISVSVRNSYCVLRYADHPFASVLEDPKYQSTNRTDSAASPATFSQQVENMLAGILGEAVTSSLRIAAGMKEVDTGTDYMNVYGLAWCTADLSPANCYQCLDHALKSYMGCCSDKVGGFSTTVSCIVAYDNFTFFNISLIQSASAPTPLPQFGTVARRHSQRKQVIMAVSISAAVVSALIALCITLICRRRIARSKSSKLGMEENIRSMESHILRFGSIKSATNNFSNENKLGEERFGPLYKGVLSDGQQVVVKRLSKPSGQGLVELKNEATLVAQLQHRNLVKLLGCCMQDDEMLLIYEYLPNESLDMHLYDPARRAQLDWDTRHQIIEGIARGLVYLHNHSRLRIIHRNLSASNILLDGGMNPKISDFGLAKLVGINESQWDTKQIAGTFGYMAPEYAMRGLFSTKSDVFSYGMVLLEIISGRRNGSFMETGNAYNLQTYVWHNWCRGRAEEVIDHGLHSQYQVDEVLRCIKIGLLCIQADPAERPSMASVVLMLSSNAEMLPAPSLPAYYMMESPMSSSSESSTISSTYYSRVLMNEVSVDTMEAR